LHFQTSLHKTMGLKYVQHNIVRGAIMWAYCGSIETRRTYALSREAPR